VALVALILLSGNPMCVAPAVIQGGGPGLAWAGETAPAAAAQVPTINWIQALIPVLVPVLIAGLKLAVSVIPGWLLPIIAPVLGGLADAGLAYVSGGTASPMLGMILGSAGVGIREIVNQMRPKSA
jgi:hypothetical protein